MSLSKKATTDQMTWSNSAYILPICAAMYSRYCGKLSLVDTIQVCIVFVSVGVLSGLYHNCMESRKYDRNMNKRVPKFSLAWCDEGSDTTSIPLRVSLFRDLIIANVAVTTTLSILLISNIKAVLPTMSLIYYMSMLGYYGLSDTQEMALKQGPHIALLLMVIVGKFQSKVIPSAKELICLGMALCAMISAVYYKQKPAESGTKEYAAHHSIWHSASGLASALVVLSTVFATK